jgi:hypothetical protein
VPALEPEVLDVGAESLGHPQAVEGQQADQRVIPSAGQPGGHQHGADLVAIETGGVGLVVQAGSTHMRRRRDRDQAFLFGVAVEAGHGAKPASDRRPGPAQRLKMAGEALDVGATCTEHRHPMLGAPGHVLAQIQCVGVAGQPAVAGQEPRQRQLLVGAEQLVSRGERGAGREGNVHDGTSKRRAEAPVAGTGQVAAPATIRGRRRYVRAPRWLQSEACLCQGCVGWRGEAARRRRA